MLIKYKGKLILNKNIGIGSQIHHLEVLSCVIRAMNPQSVRYFEIYDTA